VTFEALADSLVQRISASVELNPWQGYGLIALALLLENLLPPIPTELVMPLAGFLVHQQKLELVPVILAGLSGTVLGALFWYGIGRLVNEEHLEHWLGRRGRWLGLRAEDLATSRRWFARHGAAVVFWGRIVPGIRPFVSLPAGIELMPMGSFLLWTSAGSLIWVLALTLAGSALGANYRAVLDWLTLLTTLVRDGLLLILVGAAGWIGLRLWRHWTRHR
jgi:membrane protein DedA with SNARE-associated domain